MISLILILLSLWTRGYTVPEDYSSDINNPFHDVFYFYNGRERSQAIKILNKLLREDKYKNQALINYGLIHEYENNPSEAERKYIEALKGNERISVIYLYNLYKNNDNDKLKSFFLNNSSFTQSYWTLYERAVNHMANGNIDNALSSLSDAVDNGFFSSDLLLNDPVFENVKDTVKFRWLVHKAKSNYKESDSILQKKKETEYQNYADKPYGLIAELDTAAYYEKTGRDGKAIAILESLVNERISFRDRGIALFWLARINAKNSNKDKAEKYLRAFLDLISGQENDKTGFKKMAALLYEDIIINDRYLKNVSADFLKSAMAP